MPAAARIGDLVKQDAPHCHAPMHPSAPAAHPGIPLAINKGENTVLIGGSPAARVADTTVICSIPVCSPGGPGQITVGSATVMIGGMAAARANDMTAHTGCAAAPIPGPVGKILPPCCPTVMIGG